MTKQYQRSFVLQSDKLAKIITYCVVKFHLQLKKLKFKINFQLINIKKVCLFNKFDEITSADNYYSKENEKRCIR